MNLKKKFPFAFVRRIDKDENLINKYINEYSYIKIDNTNPYKSLEHIITGFYIKQASIKTINDFLSNVNINIDAIITIRTDTIIFENKKMNFDVIRENMLNVYICNEIDFDVYNQGACTDVLVVSNYNNMIKILNQLNYLNKVLLPDNVSFHPETSFYKYLKINNFNIIRVNLKAHV